MASDELSALLSRVTLQAEEVRASRATCGFGSAFESVDYDSWSLLLFGERIALHTMVRHHLDMHAARGCGRLASDAFMDGLRWWPPFIDSSEYFLVLSNLLYMTNCLSCAQAVQQAEMSQASTSQVVQQQQQQLQGAQYQQQSHMHQHLQQQQQNPHQLSYFGGDFDMAEAHAQQEQQQQAVVLQPFPVAAAAAAGANDGSCILEVRKDMRSCAEYR